MREGQKEKNIHMAINVKDIANDVILAGVIAGYKIEKKRITAPWGDKKGQEVDAHDGYFAVQTGENQFATVKVNKRMFSYWDGKIDGTTQVLEAMANGEYDTYAKTKDLTKTPTISVWGKDKQGHTNLKMVDYFYPQDGEIKEVFRLELGFAKISIDEPKESPRLENEVVLNGVVEDVKPEIVDDEETGRAIVTMSVPYTHGSGDKQVIRCVKTQFVAGSFEIENEDGEMETVDLGADLLDYTDEVLGYSWSAVVELNGYYVEEEVAQPEESGERKGFGRKRKTVNTKRKAHHELLLVGLDPLGDGEVFDEDDIRDAYNLRQASIAETLKRWEEKQNEPKQESTARRGSFRSNASSTTETKSEGTAPTTAGRPRFRR